MIRIAVTQRVSVVKEYSERRDCLDQAWGHFLLACGIEPLILPNLPELALSLVVSAQPRGVLLTGGNDLVAYGGDAPERDATEEAVLRWAEDHHMPVLGVCRGMQLIQHRYSVPLERVEGHVQKSQSVIVDGVAAEVNSYHCFGTRATRPPLSVWAVASDGVVKGVRHDSLPILGVMWHPERMALPRAADVEIFRRHFGA